MCIRPIILSGGAGTRLWPLSRELYPKQFISLVSQETMIQATVSRLSEISNIAAPIVLCNEDHRFLAAEQLREIAKTPQAIILEPCPKNTAPAIAAAAHYCQKNCPDDILLVLPADHVIRDTKSFIESIEIAKKQAEKNRLVTFGIIPHRPETGYGYIKATTPALENSVFKIESFVEKPDLQTAQAYIKAKNYYWNSGMFMFKVNAFLNELQALASNLVEPSRLSVENAINDNDFVRLNKTHFETCESISIDYAIMEKTKNGVVIPLDVGWDDIGSWSALSENNESDQDKNIKIGDVMTSLTENCYLRSSKRLIATVGIKDQIVVETPDAILVAHKDRVQDVKTIVENLKIANRYEARNHTKVSRPWGSYETIDISERFQVKRITVNPKASLSLQKHHHRAEHWVVVKGTAKIQKGDQSLLLTENQSTYIPLGVLHQLQNPGIIPLELIEIQSGSYLGEDDIVRYRDDYGRAEKAD